MEWLFLLLPVAAASGWLAGRRADRAARESGSCPDPAYFRGLNYLLNEQPDKAIDVFLELTEVDGETAETHLALGALFRRRGEVDRAIRIHQDLMARPKLTAEQRSLALYELGLDYMRAGLLDRAESLFLELAETRLHVQPALRALLDIYQQEKDWPRCLETAQKLEDAGDGPLKSEIAQFHCELAEQALRGDDGDGAREHLGNAQVADPDCIRASLLKAEMAMAGGDARSALALYSHVAECGPRYVPAMLPGMLDCYRRLGCQQVSEELGKLFGAQPSPPLMLELSNAIEREQGSDAAIAFLANYLREHADLTGIERLLEVYTRAQDAQGQTGDPTARIVLRVIKHLLTGQPVYQCDQCGFEARTLHWQCPSCKHWCSIKALEPDNLSLDSAGLRRRRLA